MKKQKTVICFGMTFLLLTVTGCGNSKVNSGVSPMETICLDTIIRDDNETVDDSVQQGSDEAAVIDRQSGEESDKDTQQSADDQNAAGLYNDGQSIDNQSQPVSELDGEVESIGDNSVVINKFFHPSAEVAAVYAENDEKVLVMVYFSDDTKFEVWSVRNGGVNGDSDVDKQSGTFFDIKEQSTIQLTGSYEGNDFYAKQVIIYNYT